MHWMKTETEVQQLAPNETKLLSSFGTFRWYLAVCRCWMCYVPQTYSILIHRASQCISSTIDGIKIVVIELSFIVFHFIFHFFPLRRIHFPFCKNYYFHCYNPSLCAWRSYKYITNADKINFFNKVKTTHTHTHRRTLSLREQNIKNQANR